jgi:hypothetical protein
MSFLDTLQSYVNLPFVLKMLGIILVVVGFINGWHEIRLVVKLLLVFGGIAFFVGLRFQKIYSKTPGS